MREGEHRKIGWQIALAAAAAFSLAAADRTLGERVWVQSGAPSERSSEQPVVQMTSVTGTVAAVGDETWEPVRGVGIVSDERRIYLVADVGVGRELRGLVGKIVMVAAEVRHDVDGWPYLAIEWYRVLEG